MEEDNQKINKMKDEKLRQAIRNLYDDFSKRKLTQYVTDKLKKVMKSNSIKINKSGGNK